MSLSNLVNEDATGILGSGDVINKYYEETHWKRRFSRNDPKFFDKIEVNKHYRGERILFFS